jgi:hypothetical protein
MCRVCIANLNHCLQQWHLHVQKKARSVLMVAQSRHREKHPDNTMQTASVGGHSAALTQPWCHIWRSAASIQKPAGTLCTSTVEALVQNLAPRPAGATRCMETSTM